MDQTSCLEMLRMNRLKHMYDRWKQRKLTQTETAMQPEMSSRTFRRYVDRYRNEGEEGLSLEHCSHSGAFSL